MRLIDITFAPSPSEKLWDGAYKIPWDEPEFSKRMLEMHLAQDHDWASRRLKTVDSHVDHLHQRILNQEPSRILDLACGPGLYSERLARLGHTCRAIDFSPASIAYARQRTDHPESCEYVLGDLRTADFGEQYDLAAMIYGEFNAFPREQALGILRKAYSALKSRGQFLAEVHTAEEIRRIGETKATWYQADSGLFSERPHICLTANFWHEESAAAESRFFVIDTETSEVVLYRNTLQAFTQDQYVALLVDAGFKSTRILPAWGRTDITPHDSLVLLQAVKQ